MISASHHLAIWCCSIVLPAPKPPGIAEDPPLAIGNIVSITRCPVIKGIEIGSRLIIGRGLRIAHCCISFTSTSASSKSLFTTSNTSLTVYSPLGSAFTTVPFKPTGIKERCSINDVSGVEAKICPSLIVSPAFTSIVTFHFFSRSSAGTDLPSAIKAPCSLAISSSGL